MMPVVRLNDATFLDLKSISDWLRTKTPSETIDSIVREKMQALGLERDDEQAGVSGDQSVDKILFRKAPSLSFTRILSATIDGQIIERINWTSLLLNMVKKIKDREIIGEDLARELQVPAKSAAYNREGYKYYPELGISIQGQSAPDAWREISRLADKYGIPIEVEFQWRENEKALHPGRVGTIRAGR